MMLRIWIDDTVLWFSIVGYDVSRGNETQTGMTSFYIT